MPATLLRHNLQNRQSQCWKQSGACWARHTGQVRTGCPRGWEEQGPLDTVCTVSPGPVTPGAESKCWPTCPSRSHPPSRDCLPALLSSVTCFRSGRTWVPECHLKWRLIGVWPGVLLLQQSYPLLEHPHLGLVSLHHGHHLRLQLLQFVLMLLLCFLIGSHEVAGGTGNESAVTLSGTEAHTVTGNQSSKHHAAETGHSASSVRTKSSG